MTPEGHIELAHLRRTVAELALAVQLQGERQARQADKLDEMATAQDEMLKLFSASKATLKVIAWLGGSVMGVLVMVEKLMPYLRGSQ